MLDHLIFALTSHLYCIFLDQRLVRESVFLLRKASQLSGCQDMRQCSETMEKHGGELDQDDGEEKEDENDTDGLKVKVFLGNNGLKKSNRIF